MRPATYLITRANTSLKRRGTLSPPAEQRGVPDHGRIVKLFVGQGYGYIRRVDDREIYVHRADLKEGMSINDCEIGDVVTFERVDDVVSGPRALVVQRRHPGRRPRL